MSIEIKLTRDEVTPALNKALKGIGDGKPIMQAAGTQLVSITKRAFRDPSLRQSAWPAKKSGGPSNLIDKGMLTSSIRITAVNADSVKIGSDRKYAAIPQLGGVINAKPGKRLVFTIGGKKIFAKSVNIPARPFFPFNKAGELVPFAARKVEAIVRTTLDKLFGK